MADGTVLRNAEVKSVVDGSVCLTVKEDATERKTIMILKLSAFTESARTAIGVPEAATADAAGATPPSAAEGAVSADGTAASSAQSPSPEAKAVREFEQHLASAKAARRRYKSAYDRAYRAADADVPPEEYVSGSTRERRGFLLKECRKAMDGYTSAVEGIDMRGISAGSETAQESRTRHQEALGELASSRQEYEALTSLAESRADKAMASIEAKRAQDLEERRVAAMEKQADADRRRANQEANLERQRREWQQSENDSLRQQLNESEQQRVATKASRPVEQRPQTKSGTTSQVQRPMSEPFRPPRPPKGTTPEGAPRPMYVP
jgi:hypothetical protein